VQEWTAEDLCAETVARDGKCQIRHLGLFGDELIRPSSVL
jgi:hypothetical protein